MAFPSLIKHHHSASRQQEIEIIFFPLGQVAAGMPVRWRAPREGQTQWLTFLRAVGRCFRVTSGWLDGGGKKNGERSSLLPSALRRMLLVVFAWSPSATACILSVSKVNRGKVWE